MTKKQKETLLSVIHKILVKQGYKKDSYGNFKKLSDTGRQLRVKFQKTSVRFEIKVGSGWSNMFSDYYKNITLFEDDKVFSVKGHVFS